MSVGRGGGRSLLVERIRATIGQILDNFGDNHVTQLKLNGREHEDDRMQLINLIEHPEKRQIDLAVDPVTRKIPHEVRWESLIEIRREFLNDAG